MNAVTVESISHLFVFHLVDHLCISMVGRPQVNQTFRRLQVIFNDVPSTIPNDDGNCPTKKPYVTSFSLFSQPQRGPRSSFPVPSLHSEGSRALTKAHRVQSVHLVRPRTRGLGKLHKPEPRLQGNDKGTSPRLANHGAGNSPSGPPISFVIPPTHTHPHPKSLPGASEERRGKLKRGQSW